MGNNMSKYVLRGVPRALLLDGWWLGMAQQTAASVSPDQNIGQQIDVLGRMPSRAALLAMLVLLADFLFYDKAIGISLALFGMTLAAVVGLRAEAQTGRRGLAVLMILAVLPVVEQVQILSVMFWTVGLLAVVAWAALGQGAGWGQRLLVATRFVQCLPVFAIFNLGKAVRHTAQSGQILGGLRAARHGWAMPLVVGTGFTLLIIAANPVVSAWLNALVLWTDPSISLVQRWIFWAVMAALLWPCLALAQHRAGLCRPPRHTIDFCVKDAAWFGVNPASIANALLLFNLIFAVQSGLDLTYLWVGADLPRGLSLAEYAHRGAYPLVVTALLAGVFSLISRPFTEGRPILRRLLALWLVQNILLVASALYRLDLYVENFGLTYLRIAAAIWMGLVVAGLVLTGWQLWRLKTNLWLLQCNVGLLVLVLYACCFVNFADMIARNNLARFDADKTLMVDRAYLCGLGPNAATALRDFDIRHGIVLCPAGAGPQIDGWRDWGFRSWRVQRNLVKLNLPVVQRVSE